MHYENILIENPVTGVGLIRLHRPEKYNALNKQLLTELATALQHYEKDDETKVVIITGSEKAFAAGADISELCGISGEEMNKTMLASGGWSAISRFSKPTICAVAGMALGGGFELALQCDILLAAKGAKFSFPEVNLGVIPGAGGTQRITKCVGKSLAMEMVMNARPMFAEEALQRGVVSRVIELEKLEAAAISLADEIASKAPQAVKAAKECVNKALTSSLEEGLKLEYERFIPLFDTDDAKKLMASFLKPAS